MSNAMSAYRKFDAHAHAMGSKRNYVDILDALGVEAVLNLSFSGFRPPEEILEYEMALRVETEDYPGRFYFATAFNVTRFLSTGYIPEILAKLEDDIDRHGAVAVKVWKDLGMMLTDSDGRYVFCDDERFSPIFDYISRRGLVVVMHIGDPVAAWLPLDPQSPHYGYYQAHPEFHWHGRDDRPGHDEILAHRDALVRRHPKMKFVAAHLASLEHDLNAIAAFLDAHPNASVDTAARFGDLKRMPVEEVRDFFLRYSDRILYGTDWEFDATASENGHADRTTIVEGFRRHFDYFERTLALPEDVLQRFYFENAARLFMPA